VPLRRVDETNLRPIGYADCHRWTSNRIVTDRKLPEAKVDAVSEQLQDGIQSCRSVVANYRSLLTGEAPIETAPAEEASGDEIKATELPASMAAIKPTA